MMKNIYGININNCSIRRVLPYALPNMVRRALPYALPNMVRRAVPYAIAKRALPLQNKAESLASNSIGQRPMNNRHRPMFGMLMLNIRSNEYKQIKIN
jgi:hypothetical protein